MSARKESTEVTAGKKTVAAIRTADNEPHGDDISPTAVIRQLEDQAAHFASFPQLNPNPVLEVDLQGTIVYANPASRRILDNAGMETASLAAFLPADFDDILQSWDRSCEVTLSREIVLGKHSFDETVFLSPLLDVVRIYAYEITAIKAAESALRQAKEEWERTFDSVPDLIAIMDSHHRIVRANKAMALRLGITPEECVGRHCYQSVHGAGGPLGSCPHALSMADGREHVAEVHEERLGGDFLISTTPLLNEGGQMIGTVHVARDISGHKQAEEALRRYELLAGNSRDIILFIRLEDGRILEANVAATEAYGYDHEELLQLTIHDLRLPSESHLAAAQFAEADTRGILFESVHRRKDGTTLPVEVSSCGATIGNTRLLLSVIRDISERKRADEALRQSESRVRRKLDSILSPKGDLGDLDLADIIDAGAMQSLMDNFYKLTRMPMGLIDLKGTVLVGVGWQEICTRFHRTHPETCSNCIESDTQLSAGVPAGEYKLYKCRNNLWDVATPIMVGGRHFGNFFIGQFFFDDEPLDYEFFRAQARRFGFDESAYIGALESVPRLDRESLAAGMAYFMKLADMISRMSYSNLQLARSLAERDALMESLEDARDELEQRVRERTEELAMTVETVLEEITVRQRAEAGLQQLNRLYAVLSETNQAIVRAADPDSLLRDFCQIAVEHGGFLLSCASLVAGTGSQVQIAAACGATAYLEAIRVNGDKNATGELPVGSTPGSGNCRISNDYQNDPATRPWHEQARAHGIHASAAIALRDDEKLVGELTLYAGEKDFFDEQHVALLMQIGADISFALENFKREARRRQAEQALREETLERLRTVEALREKEQLLLQQSRLAAMGEMINNIAHQWRQPLNVLGLKIQRLQLFYDLGKCDREFLQTNTDDAMKLVSHMSQTIDVFRNFFKADKEKITFSVEQAIRLTISLLSDGLKNRPIEFITRIQGEPTITGYYNEFCQVLLNVLQNAIDALGERRIAAGTVIFDAAAENGRTVITVTDNAGGIPEEIVERIFEPYFSTKGLQGTGIGLFMSKSIIETSMGGSITVRNVSQGSEFRIEV